ncbi:MAG: formyltetrahydrofolate deformylase [Phycisphaerales bacterium]|nr:formyltetrahydrofolate deformylase [Phycisphaerales bacterium]MCB9835837.1 formyltetrahydrofolate deformylase [Phycisphaera sp.]
MSTSRLLIECPDARGVVARVAACIADAGGNILDADQHTDADTNQFFMRVEFEPGPGLTERAFIDAFRATADNLAIAFRLRWADAPARRVAILCSKSTHCLSDLLWRFANGDFPGGEAALVVSNHEAGRSLAEHAGVGFVHEPIADGDKSLQEQRLIGRIDDAGADLIVLARYMQVLSADFVERFRSRAINIHHSFLPAFAGARPYHQAFERGVKLIGATSHYVTEDLDDGPIIAQRTARVSHRDTVSDLVRKGRDLERVVLADAVRLHLEDRVLVSGRKTVVFD